MVDFGRRWSWLLVLGMIPACASATQRGKSLYVEGRLIEAAEVFEHGESSLERVNPRDRVRYGLYRGATLLALGDLDGAARWLYFAQQAESQRPGSIEPSDAQTLRLAFKDLDRRRALAKPNVDPLTGAMAQASAGPVAYGPDVIPPAESSVPPSKVPPPAAPSRPAPSP